MKMFLKQSFSGKKVFITGHTGFKGSWLVKILSMLGAEIYAMSLKPNYPNNLFEVLKIKDLCSSIEGDICNEDKLKSAILSCQPDFIFHLAAQALVKTSYQDPLQTFITNSIGTANLLNILRDLEKPCVSVIITTDKVYHNNEWVHPYRESDALGGYDPYSASKACAELVVNSYRQSFFNKELYKKHNQAIFTVRAGNVIGGGDWATDRLVPDIVKALSLNKEIILRNPLSVRPWQHVFEPLFAYLLIAGKGVTNYLSMSESYNIGPQMEDTLTVQCMTELAINIWGQGNYRTENSDLHEAKMLKLDISKILDELNWKPQLHAKQALEMTINWYKTFLKNPEQIISFSEEQITQFIEIK